MISNIRVVGQCSECGESLTMNHVCQSKLSILTKEEFERFRQELTDKTTKRFEEIAKARRESWRQAKDIVFD